MQENQKIDIVIFSKDRAMQLDATIRSFYLHCVDHEICNLFVDYTNSNLQHDAQYEVLKQDFPEIIFINRVNLPKEIQLIFKHSTHCGFFADDIVFSIDFKMQDVASALTHNKQTAVGFFLRMGTNIKYSQYSNLLDHPPTFHSVDATKNILKYNWRMGINGDNYNYPSDTATGIFLKSTIETTLENTTYDRCTALECCLLNLFQNSIFSDILCFNQSTAIQFMNNNCENNPESTMHFSNLFNQDIRILFPIYSGFTHFDAMCHTSIVLYNKNDPYFEINNYIAKWDIA